MKESVRWALGAAVSVLTVTLVVRFALARREGPARCPEGLVALAGRCCGEKQHVEADSCRGSAAACATGQELTADGACVAPTRRVRIETTAMALRGPDWEGQTDSPGLAKDASFELDATEVTGFRYAECATAGACEPLRSTDESSLPVRNVTAASAEKFCAFAGGRLPTGPEWIAAAVGTSGRRYPWGSTGLVCRRAAFGLIGGPCAESGSGPDTPGSRPDGATPEGILDLAGNVAEWAREPNGTYRAHGGSYASESAADLKSWATMDVQIRSAEVGFRCAYPPKPEKSEAPSTPDPAMNP